MRSFVFFATVFTAASVLVGQDPELEPTTTTTTPDAIVTCEDIQSITVGNQDWTDVTRTVCNLWPTAQFGAFPVASITQLKTLLANVFTEGGMWDQLKKLFSEKSDLYCLRLEATRMTMTTSAAESETCPAVLDEELLEEMPDVIDGSAKQGLLTGYWACIKVGGSNCDCTRRDTQQVDEQFPVISIASRPSGCKMVHSGTCYGDCPAGYRPTFLTGWFRPVCTSVCAATNHPVTCGVGCANSRSSCASVIMNQVKEVAIASSKVAAFFTTGVAGVVLAESVEKVVKVAEFGFNILSKVLQAADTAFQTFKREEAELATLMSIFQVIKDLAGQVAADWLQFLGLMEQSGKLFLQLIDAQFGWKNINLGWISGVIMQNGVDILTSAFDVTKAFAYGKCAIATDEVSHTVENVGDQRVIGPWTADGSVNSKPRYRALRDRSNVMMEWSSRATSWSIWVKDVTFGRGWWFGWVGFGWRELYESRSATPTFPTTGWKKIEGALPLPLLVSATNGGV